MARRRRRRGDKPKMSLGMRSRLALARVLRVLPASSLAVERVDVPVAGLASDVRVAQLSDLHFFPGMFEDGDGATRRVFDDAAREVNAAEADLVVLTGDLVDHHAEGASRMLADFCAGLRARHGVWAVLGNHDYRLTPEALDELEADLEGAGARLLRNEAVLDVVPGAGGLALVGLGDVGQGRRRHRADFDPEAAFEGVPAGAPRLVLSHQPRSVADLLRGGYRSDVVLAGHTHGGLWNLPGWMGGRPLGVRQKWLKGLCRLGGDKDAGDANRHSWLYVNRGMSDIRHRLFCDPEVSVLRLVPAADADAGAQ